jgi:hypothetical protein
MLTRTAPPDPSAAARAREFRQMLLAFVPSGGIASSVDVVDSLMRFTSQPVSRLARWIVDDELLRFEWQGRMMLPMFQFDRACMAPAPSVLQVVRELLPALSDWDACLWFARPNARLGDDLPVEVLRTDPAAVRDAARAGRFPDRA